MSTASTERPSPSQAEMPDGLLIAEHLEGSDEAFEILYRRYNDRLVGWFVRRLDDRALAEDLAQDTMVRVLKYADSFDQDRPMWPWLKTTAHRVMVNHLQNRPDDDKSLEDQYEDEGEADPLLSSVEERPALERVMRALSERHRTALSLRYVRGWSPGDIADYLGMTRNACNQLMYRARNAARREYERICGEIRAIVAPVFGGAFARMRALGERMRQTLEGLGLASATAAAEAFAHLAIALALTAVEASGAMASTSASTPATHPSIQIIGAATVETQSNTPTGPDPISVEPPTVPAPPMNRTAPPPANKNRVEIDTSSDDLGTDLARASMTTDATADGRDGVSVGARIVAYVPGTESPAELGTGAEYYCDTDSMTMEAACTGLDVLEGTAPPPTK